MVGNLRDAIPLAGGKWLYSFSTPTPPGEWFDDLKGKTVTVDIKKASKGRSLDANAMCWALCTAIGNSMTPPLDKVEVYRDAIRAVGVYTPVTVVLWDVVKVCQRWSTHGVGWFAEIVDDAGIGRKLVHLYCGSSTYTVDEMRVLIDYLVDQCQQMQIAIPLSKDEEEKLLERWGKK